MIQHRSFGRFEPSKRLIIQHRLEGFKPSKRLIIQHRLEGFKPSKRLIIQHRLEGFKPSKRLINTVLKVETELIRKTKTNKKWLS